MEETAVVTTDAPREIGNVDLVQLMMLQIDSGVRWHLAERGITVHCERKPSLHVSTRLVCTERFGIGRGTADTTAKFAAVADKISRHTRNGVVHQFEVAHCSTSVPAGDPTYFH